MISKGLASVAVFLALLQLYLPAGAQSKTHPATDASTTPAPAAQDSAGSPGTRPDCQNGPCDYQPAHITIATPAPAPAPWPLQDRIAWAANILLAVLGYGAILLVLSTLKKIERQWKFVELA